MKMSEDERQCLSESRGGSANVISIFSYCARRYCNNIIHVIGLQEFQLALLFINYCCFYAYLRSIIIQCHKQQIISEFLFQELT